jgi:hypothetical protein
VIAAHHAYTIRFGLVMIPLIQTLARDRTPALPRPSRGGSEAAMASFNASNRLPAANPFRGSSACGTSANLLFCMFGLKPIFARVT